MTNRLALCAAVLILAGCSKKTPDAASLEQQFKDMISGATLVGHSTLNNRDGLSGEERYAIDKVYKVGGDTWMFQSRMKLDGHEMPFRFRSRSSGRETRR